MLEYRGMKELCLRLTKGEDLKLKLEELGKDKNLVVLSAVGSLTNAKLRMAKAIDYKQLDEDLEIVSLIGTVCKDGAHLHGTFSDVEGKVIGGHVCEGCIINTTCELVLGILEEYELNRKYDEKTGFNEIVFRRIAND